MVLDYFIHAQIDPSGHLKQTTRTVARILRLQGIAAVRQVRIGWFPSRENRPRIKARVITPDGKAHMLDESSITDASLPPASPDDRSQVHLLSAILPSVDFDTIVELETEQSDRESLYPGGRWGEIALDPRNPIYRFSAVFDSESPHALRVEPRAFAEAKQSETQTTAGRQIIVEASRISPPRNQVLLPPDVPPSPVLTFSNVDSWQEVAQWFAQMFTAHPDALAAPFGASINKAVLLIAKLKAQGLPAKAAAIRAAPSSELVPTLPGLEVFNRVLVYVPGPQPRWIDPTNEFTPATQLLPVADQGRWALVADASTTDLVRTPESTAQDNRRIDITDIQLLDGAPAHVRTNLEAHGAFEEALQQKDKSESTTEGYTASHVGDTAGFIDLPGPGSFNFQSLGPLLDPRAQDDPGRKLDYYVVPPFSEESRYHVTLPSGFRFVPLAPVADMTLGPLALSASARLEGDQSLTIEYGLASPKTRYTPQEASAIRRDAAQKLVNKGMLRVVFVNIGEEKLANGDVKGGLELLRQNAGSSPNAALRLADGYLAAGSRDDAVKVCQQVIAKNPKNANAYLHLGWVYAHDPSGQLYREGMNSAEAEKAYRKAIELNPDDHSYLIQLATLYTYNCCGIRYGNGARFSDAIDTYTQAGFRTLSAAQALNDLAATFLFAGKYDEIRQFYLYPEAEAADPSIRIAGVAASMGAGDAREEVAFLSLSTPRKAEILAHAVHSLVLARDYGPAAELGLSDARFRRARKFDNAAASPEPAIAALQRFIQALLNPSAPDEWKKFAAPEAGTVPVADYRSRLLKLFSPSGAVPEPVEWPSIADALTSTLDFRVEGTGETYAVLAGSKTIAHVVKRGNEFLVDNLVP